MIRPFRRLAARLLILSAILVPLPAAAGPLDGPKGAGQVGEQADGYAGLVTSSVPAAVRRMVEEINLKRREQYRAIAKKNGTSLKAVEQVFGERLVGRAAPGEYIRQADGRWVRK